MLYLNCVAGLPMTTMEKLERIVDQTREQVAAGKITYKELLSPPAVAPAAPAGRFTRCCAWGILVLFLVVPLLAAITPKPNLLWGAWAIISAWAAADSHNLGAALSSANRPVVAGRVLVVGLAAWNLLIAICAMFLPSLPRL